MTAAPSFIEGWELERCLGAGGFGLVQLWVHAQSGKKLAIKKCKWDSKQLTEIQKRRWINEVQIMKRLKHGNIVKAIDLPFKLPDDDANLPPMCMEYCRKGDLRRVLNKVQNCCGIEEKEAINAMKDIASAVEYLHSHNITHRDLKPENIVLQDERNNTVYKLIDLGYAKELGEASTSASIVGTLNYVAPELLWNQKYSCSVDYWSLGILFYELITGTRPFLPKMQHTMIWMQHVKSKGYNDICATEVEGQIIFGKEIEDPTHISMCLRKKLVEWFRVVLQWYPKRRGKQYDDKGVMQLVVFKLLDTILSKKIVYVFSMSLYKIDAYEVADTTSVAELQYFIEKATDIPMNQQILTDYFGKVLPANEKPLLSQIRNPMLFIFKNGDALMDRIPPLNIPAALQRMIELSRNQLDFHTIKDYYRATFFFIKNEVHLLQLYIFALTIKVDLIFARLNAFHENLTNTLTNINNLLSELHVIRKKWDREKINDGKRKILEIYFEKVVKLVNATDQIKMKFEPLTQESNELKNAAHSIDCITKVYQLYDKVITIFEAFKAENSHKPTRPTEMVKLIFEFLKMREAEFNNENIAEIIKQISNLEVELLTLDRIFDSVIAMTTVYREELQKITHLQSTTDIPATVNDPCSSISAVGEKIVSLSLSDSDAMEVTNESDEIESKNSLADTCSKSTESDDNVIYDNLVIRYTLDNLLLQMRQKYMEMVSLDL